MPTRYLLYVGLIATLGACGGGGADDEPRVVVDPPPVTFSTNAIAITKDRLDNTLGYPRNQTTAITGSAEFIGGFAADLTVNGDAGQHLVGNIDMSMNFDTDQVTGVMRNMGIANDSGEATEGVLGEINLSGTVGPVAASSKPDDLPGSSGASSGVAQNILQASGTGILLGNFGEDTQGAVTIDSDLVAHARDPEGDSRDWFSGVISGDGDGAHDVDFQGRFYLFEN